MMSDNNSSTTGPTRRDTLKYGAATAASLGLAGCSESTSQTSGNETPTGTGSYEVCM